MPENDWIIPIVLGSVFILLGIGAIMWGRGEEKDYYNSMTSRVDVREFMDHQPQYPQFGALKIGGRIAITIGIVLLIVGIILLL